MYVCMYERRHSFTNSFDYESIAYLLSLSFYFFIYLKVWAIMHLLYIVATTTSGAVGNSSAWLVSNPLHGNGGNTSKTPDVVQEKFNRMLDTPPAAYYGALFSSVFIGIDVIIRLLATPNCRLLKKFMNLVDLLTFANVVAQTVLYNMVSIQNKKVSNYARPLMILKVTGITFMQIRIFRAGRYSIGIRTLLLTLRASIKELLTLFAFLCIGMSIFGNLLYFTEITDRYTSFESIPSGFWWALITMTTVGYGDMYPRTALGKVFGIFCAISGLVLTSLAIPILSKNFHFYYDNAKMLAKMKQLKLKKQKQMKQNQFTKKF